MLWPGAIAYYLDLTGYILTDGIPGGPRVASIFFTIIGFLRGGSIEERVRTQRRIHFQALNSIQSASPLLRITDVVPVRSVEKFQITPFFASRRDLSSSSSAPRRTQR